jgi:hypothetical protein
MIVGGIVTRRVVAADTIASRGLDGSEVVWP